VKSVLIADNHPLFRAGVRQVIEESAGYYVLDEAGDCESCVFKVKSLQPDILLLDLNMPSSGGFDVARKLRGSKHSCRIVVLSMHASADFVTAARQEGCAGFVAKEDAGTELLTALDNLKNGFQMTSSVGQEEFVFANASGPTVGFEEDMAKLTKTEKQVLASIASSLTSQEIANQLNVSARTVESHRSNISRKLELSGPNSLVRYAVEHKAKILLV